MEEQRKAPQMARKKQEVQLQQVIETQEEWEDVMGKEGLFVIDVYQEWCGACAGMAGNFKKIKNEIGDDLLRFAKAKSDTIDSLEKYRGHCEPCFLFYAGGILVSVVRGANAPLIMRTITEQLAHEHKVIDGQAERKEIKDPYIAQLDSQDLAQEEEEQEEEEDGQMKFRGELIGDADTLEPTRRRQEGKKEVTIALIKPDAVQAGKVDDILADIKAAGIEVLKQEERTMTEDEVRNFYSHLQDEEYFEDLIKFMTSGPSHILVLTKGPSGQNIINEFRDLIGPTSVEDAKEAHPESLRAKHGSEKFMNALHGSSSEEQAHRELAFFFPDYAVPAAEGKPKLQRTLALIRPDAFKQHRDEILQKINDAGFKVAMQKEITLTKETAEDFYKEHQGQDYFEELTTRMSSGPLFALGLAREDAVQGWRDMLGPKEVDKAKEESPDSLRAQFAVDDIPINQLHGSDSEESAKRELEYFFPMQQTVAVIKPNAIGTKDEIIDKIHDAGFRIAARKETTLSRDIAEEFYADHKDKPYYSDLVDNMTSGPTYFMVLSREDAVDGWRSVIGPTDPAKAKEENPESLRALYGESILQNAVHGSSSVDHAKQSMEKIFGELHFRSDGSLEEGDEQQQETQAPETQQEQTEGDEKKSDEQTEQTGEQMQEQTEQSQEQAEQSQEQTEQSQEQTEQSQEQMEQSQEQTEQSQEQTEQSQEQTNTLEQGLEEGQGQITDENNHCEAEVTQQAETEGRDEQVFEPEEKPAEPEKPAEEAAQEEEKPKEEEKVEETPQEQEQEVAESTQPTDTQNAAPEARVTAQEEEKPSEEQKEEEAPKEEEKKEEEAETQQEEAKETTEEQKTGEEAPKEEAKEEEQKPSEGEEEQKPANTEQSQEKEEEKKDEAKPDEG